MRSLSQYLSTRCRIFHVNILRDPHPLSRFAIGLYLSRRLDNSTGLQRLHRIRGSRGTAGKQVKHAPPANNRTDTGAIGKFGLTSPRITRPRAAVLLLQRRANAPNIIYQVGTENKHRRRPKIMETVHRLTARSRISNVIKPSRSYPSIIDTANVYKSDKCLCAPGFEKVPLERLNISIIFLLRLKKIPIYI